MDLFKYLRPASSTPQAEHQPHGVHNARETLRARTVELIRPGFVSLDEALETAGSFAEDEALPVRPDEIERIVTATWDDLADCQRDWASEGDYEKLRAAFADLEQAGVVARMNFACCQNCGHAEIEAERTIGKHVGYVFFHQQDAERLAGDDAELLLAFGTFAASASQTAEERAEAEQQLGRLVATTMRSNGLAVEWDEQTSSRIAVSISHWRKRLPFVGA
ncbi:hypothetical protein C5E07_06745 [Pseudoclavibacter sp. RFBJ3]|uniref:DUF6891 domain-containing protein n=1 Tax=unclassified Pseudoclavibacter TaxID=2615177 RepID=UPI000CE7EB93|nr:MULTISPECIES: hypothetical protein [unclassified Pseudoclavibacter]PPF85414.1 hypothetical protein C5C12_04030 [Pseudoclavibacter sp. RFBJ5]PPF93192.1 hypothetical protein C5E07_06745 [Pseudoclavibacter sp. RFBJ3]PPF99212.1 hypothetical protein C5C19_06025 [Pseudoclavibacter sp. RFBH5]PPG25491.1 hypothetical protein C5E13_03085 [Pseudoclavibacter sp. RFBI4]